MTGLKVFSTLNGQSFKDIGKIDEKLQDKIRYCKIHTITFKKDSDRDLKFEIFERLNTGAVSLNDQELRNCVYRGPYNKLLTDLSQDGDFRSLLGLNNFEKRMRDVELVLRFSAFYHSTYLKYKPTMKRFLNDDMEKYQFIQDKEVDELKNAFKNAVTIVNSLLSTTAFNPYISKLR